MKTIATALGTLAALVGCTVNGASPITSWGKQGVSMLDYRTDGGQCAVLAVSQQTDANGAKTAGGLSGSNAGAQTQAASGSATAGAGPAASSDGGSSTTGSTYRDSGSADFATRAALQQRTQEMSEQRIRNDALKACLVSRGYTEFSLTAEQRAHLATLPQGSEERRDYLFELGTNPEVLNKQAVKQAASPATR